MNAPLVTVVIPAYNGGDLLADAVRSVLEQTYTNVELLVVDDASPHGCRSVVDSFQDDRLRYLGHAVNQGAQAARGTGVNASRGSIIAFLDQDDLFDARKLERHVAFMEAHPEVGLTYNPHLTQLHPAPGVVGVWRPPARLTLADVVLGFPIAPSVWVMRREWALRPELWDEDARLRGAEAVICGRLLVAGCRFGMVDQALNVRRLHAGRRFTDPAAKCAEERRCQDRMIDDPRCPPGLQALRPAAHAGNYLVWANVALAQRETGTGLALLREAVRLAPSLLEGSPSPLVDFLVSHAVNESPDPETQLRLVMGQAGIDWPGVGAQVDAAVRHALLLVAARHALWGRDSEAQAPVQRARELEGSVGEHLLRQLSYEWLCHELEYGRNAAREATDRLAVAFEGVPGWSRRRFAAVHSLARPFHDYDHGRRAQVPLGLLRAFLEHPGSVRNRGAWSRLLRSTVGLGAARQADAPIAAGRRRQPAPAGSGQGPGRTA